MIQNKILRILPTIEWNKVRSHLEPVRLIPEQLIYQYHQVIDDIVFIESGVVTQLTEIDEIEARQIGFEGIVGGMALFDEGFAILRTVVLAEGAALKIRAMTARNLLPECSVFHTLCQKYHHVVLASTAQLLECNLHHALYGRLARWLVMFRERLRDETLPVTHELIARMLGVRRPSLSLALHRMQEQGLIRQAHGRLIILDPQRLESQACPCYEIVKHLDDGWPPFMR